MPVAAKTKTTSKIQPKNRAITAAEEDEDVETETETKAEPKTQISPGLAELVTKWATAVGRADSYFPQIVQYVIEEGTERKELKQALMDIRGMEKITANNEVSVIMRVSEYPEEVERCLNKEITVRQLRDTGKKEHDDKDDPDTKFEKSLNRIAGQAITEIRLNREDFLAMCRSAYNKKNGDIKAKEARAAEAKESGDGEGEGEGDEDETV
jgi:hypothetical protein